MVMYRPGSRARLEQRALPAIRRDAKVFVCKLCRYPAARSTVQKSYLNEKRLVDLFDRVRFFGEGGGKCVHANRPALILLNDRQQQLAINLVETVTVHFEHLQRGLRRRQIDLPSAAHLRVIAHPTEKAIRNSWRSPRPAGDLQCALAIDLNS